MNSAALVMCQEGGIPALADKAKMRACCIMRSNVMEGLLASAVWLLTFCLFAL